MKSLVLCLLALVAVEAVPVKKPANDQNIKYIVYPGLDVDNAAIAGWYNGYSSPWNVFFGTSPYVVGWVGQDDGQYAYEDSEDYDSEEEYHHEIIAPVADAPHDEVDQDRHSKTAGMPQKLKKPAT